MSFKDYSQQAYDWLTGVITPSINLSNTAGALLKGTATGGTETTIVDTSKDFDTAAFATKIAKVTIGDIEYYRAISACGGDTITITTILDAVGSIAVVGSGEGAEGQVSIHCKGDLIGVAGNDYSVQIVQGTATTGDDIATLNTTTKTLTITVNLDGSSNPRTLAAGTLQTLLGNTVGIADKFEIPAGFTAGNLPIGGDAIAFTGGIDSIPVPAGASYEILMG